MFFALCTHTGQVRRKESQGLRTHWQEDCADVSEDDTRRACMQRRECIYSSVACSHLCGSALSPQVALQCSYVVHARSVCVCVLRVAESSQGVQTPQQTSDSQTCCVLLRTLTCRKISLTGISREPVTANRCALEHTCMHILVTCDTEGRRALYRHGAIPACGFPRADACFRPMHGAGTYRGIEVIITPCSVSAR